MIELLHAAAAKDPDGTAVVSPTTRLTYRQLVEQAHAVAGGLTRLGVERFAVVEPDAAIVWVLLAAASLCGAEACIYPPAASETDIAVLRERFAHEVIVTAREDAGPGALRLDALRDAGAGSGAEEPPQRERPLLILTSGTTGPAKAVRHDWPRLLRGTDQVETTPDHRWLLAYGLNQFGGLQILLHVAAAASTLIAGESFRPRDGLAAMRRWDVTHASGTPTFWRFLLAELRADAGAVPALRQITLSGEAVPAPLLDQLKERFPGARISQIYGATEMGQTITVRDGLAGLPLSFLDEGRDVTFKVVDGELWVRTRAAMLGYYGHEPFTPDAWRATGDLVEIVDERIQFRGRRTDVINVGGVKVHPLPVEELVSRIDGVALARVYARPNTMVGHIVALEVVPLADADEERLRAEIRDACAQLPPAARPRSVKFVQTIDTQGNKLTRGVAE